MSIKTAYTVASIRKHVLIRFSLNLMNGSRHAHIDGTYLAIG